MGGVRHGNAECWHCIVDTEGGWFVVSSIQQSERGVAGTFSLVH